ncbi:MAG: hypothetical protein H7X92_14775 [Chitinophagales bacterium]|nr:hypothetical protein [Hyphomicrobiales bacterium]
MWKQVLCHLPRIAALTLLGFTAALRAEATPYEEYTPQECEIGECRPATKLRMKVAPNETQEVDIPSTAYHYSGLIRIISGETLYFEMTPRVNPNLSFQSVTFVFVTENRNPAITLTVSLKEVDGPDGKPAAFMEISNPLSSALIYRVYMSAPGEQGSRIAQVCPVMPGQTTFEHWRKPVEQLVLIDFRLETEAAAQEWGCRS